MNHCTDSVHTVQTVYTLHRQCTHCTDTSVDRDLCLFSAQSGDSRTLLPVNYLPYCILLLYPHIWHEIPPHSSPNVSSQSTMLAPAACLLLFLVPASKARNLLPPSTNNNTTTSTPLLSTPPPPEPCITNACQQVPTYIQFFFSVLGNTNNVLLYLCCLSLWFSLFVVYCVCVLLCLSVTVFECYCVWVLLSLWFTVSVCYCNWVLKFLNALERFWTLWKVFNSFQIFWKYFGQSWKFSDAPDSFWMFWKIRYTLKSFRTPFKVCGHS